MAEGRGEAVVGRRRKGEEVDTRPWGGADDGASWVIFDGWNGYLEECGRGGHVCGV